MKLNNEQKQFVNSNRPVVLVACPGGGKTTAIAHKYSRIVRDWKCNHSGIALLSFTNVAADELEKKIIELDGSKVNVGYPHYIGTIDSFFNKIIKRFGYLLFGVTPNIVLDFALKWKSNDCHYCANSNWDANLNIDGSYVIGNKEITCSTEKWNCLKTFNNMIRKGIILQNSVPFFLNQLFKKYDKVLRIVAKRFPIIIIDEAQDTSKDQAYIFEMLEKANVCINYVGDPDQSIYEWRNAYPDFFLNKMKDSTYEQLRFFRNNRSSQLICDATKGFGIILSKMPNYISEAKWNNIGIKPILLHYDSSVGYDDLILFFLNKIKEYNLCEDSNKYIIIQNFKEENLLKYTNLYDESNKLMDYYMNGIYEFFYGSRKQADEFFMNCLRLLRCGDVINDEDEKIRIYLNDFKKSIPLLKGSIRDWENSAINNILNFIDVNDAFFNKPYVFKMKKCIRGLINYKSNLIKDSFYDSSIFKSTIHSVKGKTYESVLLFTKKGKKINGKTLVDRKTNEATRMAFVAMTRAQKFLCVAVDMDNDYSSAFPPTIWNYVELRK